MRKISLILFCLIAILAGSSDRVRPLGDAGYRLAEDIRSKADDAFYISGISFDIPDPRRFTVLKTMQTDTIYGCFFIPGIQRISIRYVVWSSVDRIEFLEYYNSLKGLMSEIEEIMTVATSVLEDKPIGNHDFVILAAFKYLYKDGSFKLLQLKPI